MISRRALLAAPACVALGAAGPPRVDSALVDPYTDAVARRAPRRQLPYIALYERSGYRLTYVAARHDTGGATFRAIDVAFRRTPNALIVEGFPSAWGESPERVATLVRNAAGDPKEAGIYLRGEPGHALARAVAEDLPFWGGEPESAEIDRALAARGYAAGDVAGVMMLQWLPQGRIAGAYADNKDARFRGFLDATAARIAADYSMGLVFSREIYERWHERQFGVSVYEDGDYAERLDPARQGLAAEISRAMTLVRDRHIFTTIMRVLARREHTLVVYGGAHLATQARALAAALGPPRIVS
ncbi:MAG: hypothetical protein JNJ73_10350 [Hyphomonadaceae bacterium]|nr:hypothetical protein [Hyphomonadaceae bacterium]